MNRKLRDLMITNFLAIMAGLCVSAAVLLFIDVNPFFVMKEAMRIIVTDRYTLGEVFLKSTPLIFTALSFAFTYKANLFNIGAQGQFYIGSIVAISSSLFLQDKLPNIILLILICLLTAIAGGIVGGLIGFFKAKFHANEFLVSMMSTYIVLALMNYLLRTFLKETKGEYPQTDALIRNAWIPTIVPGTRLNAAFIWAVIIAVCIWILLYKTKIGFQIRVVGHNAHAAKISGIQSEKIYVLAFFISGALAGMAGFTEVNGVQHMLIQEFNVGIGAAGIGIAILANANPLGIIFSSLLFGLLNTMGTLMGRMNGVNVPSSIIDLMQGSVMIFVIIAYFVRQYLEIHREKERLKKV